MEKVDLSNVINRRWEERGKQLDEVRKKMRSGWKNDSGILHEYFRACVVNWKAYNGPKPERVVTRLYGLYKQAVFGDCDQMLAHERHTLVGKKWAEWDRLKGMSQLQAKRRFITYLAEVDPLLIDVMPNEMPPEGFPVDVQGLQICAKCNTVVGCHRPLMDQHGTVLRRQLFEMDELHRVEALQEWVHNALQNQRCIWGVHKPISRVESKQFNEWFCRDENRGFFMYDSSNVMLMVKDLVSFHYEIAYDMQSNKDEYTTDEVNTQTIKVLDLSKYYTTLTGETFVFEVPCTRDNDTCRSRRIADNGENHKHPVELEPPAVDYSPYENAVRLRKQCQELGLDPHTGVQRDVEKRCAIYRERINAYFERKEKADAAKARNDKRHMEHVAEKKKVLSLAAAMLVKHMVNACTENDINKILSLSARGCSCNVETPRGCRPLLCLMLNSATTEQLQTLIQRGAHVNAGNRYGMTPLMLACRLKDVKVIHVLMKTGADEVGSEGNKGMGRTALHYCALHGSEEEVRVITDYVLEGGEDALRVIRYLDYQDNEGESPLMLAAKYRNGTMCRLFISLGANPTIRNNYKRTAAYLARNNGHRLLADWLDTKTGAGVASIETFSDMQFEKVQRYSGVQLKEMIQSIAKKFLLMLQDRSTSSLLSCPSRTREYARVHGDKGLREQSQLTNRYYLFFIMRKFNSRKTSQDLDDLTAQVREVVEHLRLGNAYPSHEAPEKPLPWTPLMCACAINDIRSIRLICHEGADPNHQNRHGTTALMLAAQLNNIDAMCELLHLGANMDVTDNEGFTALAYSSSLPLPVALSRSVINVIYNGDTEGKKRLCSEEVLKLATQLSVVEIKDRVAKNKAETSDEALRREFLHRALLEKNGLSRIESMDDMLEQMTGMTWRVDADMTCFYDAASDDLSASVTGDVFGDSLEDDNFLADTYDNQAALKKMAAEREDDSKNPNDIRCPICTLPIPCKHFFKVNSVVEYVEKKMSGKSDYFTQSKSDITGTSKRSVGSKKSKMAKKVFDDMANAVLAEAGLNDRHTDRNLEAYIKPFGQADRRYDRSIEWKKTDYQREQMGSAQSHDSSQPSSAMHDKVADRPLPDVADSSMSQSPCNPEQVLPTDDMNAIDESSNNEDDHGETESPATDEHIAPVTTSESSVVDSGSVDGKGIDGQDEAFHPLPLPVDASHVPSKSLLKKTDGDGADPKKKYKSHRRVIRFALDDGVVMGGVEEGDTSTTVSTYEDALAIADSAASGNSVDSTELQSLAVLHDAESLADCPQSVSSNSSLAVTNTKYISKVAKNGVLTKDQEALAMASIAHGHVLEDARDLTMRIGINPVKVHGRTVHMFTRGSDSAAGEEEVENDDEGSQGIDGYNTGHVMKSVSSPRDTGTETTTALVRRADSVGASLERITQTTLSGWLFSGIHSLELSVKPFETLRVSMVDWVECVTDVEQILRSSWAPDLLKMESLVEATSWAITASKCRACAVGIMRQKEKKNIIDDSLRELCLPCMARKTLYDNVVRIQPRPSRKRFLMPWPFHIEHPDDGCDKHALCLAGTSLVMSDEYAVDTVLLKQQEQAHAQAQQKKQPKIFIKRGDSYNLQAILRKKELDRKKEAGDDDSSVFTDSTMLSSVSMNTCSTGSSNVGDDISLYGPRELAMLPLLLAKSNFDEAERILRVCIARPEYAGDQGALFVAKLMQVQAEMYKMLGLYVLALGLYMDSADLIVTRLGFDSKESFQAFGQVESLLSRMEMHTEEETFSRSIKSRLEKHYTSSRKVDLTASYLDERSARQRTEKGLLQLLTESGPGEVVPTRRLWRDLYFIAGPAAMRALFLSATSAGFAARIMFVGYCEKRDSIVAGPYARFCCESVLLRNCSYLEVFQHQLRRVCSNFLSQNTAGENAAVAALYQQAVPIEGKERINAFLRFGSHISSDVLDPVFKICLEYLQPIFQFLHVSTVLIQNKWRVILAKRRTREIERVRLEVLLAVREEAESVDETT